MILLLLSLMEEMTMSSEDKEQLKLFITILRVQPLSPLDIVEDDYSKTKTSWHLWAEHKKWALIQNH